MITEQDGAVPALGTVGIDAGGRRWEMVATDVAVPAEVCPPPSSRALKRASDIVMSLPVALVAALLFPLLALAVRLDSRGPILFRQRRVGRDGQEIHVYKFRSMYADAEERLANDPEMLATYLANGHKLPEGSDPRITRVGRFLRKTSLDEIPQFFCVLRGTMSMVGPRPVLPSELPVLYEELEPSYCAVKPGITGLWQVSGRSNITNRQRAELDARYVEEWSLWLDIKILLRTIPAVLRADGAH